MRRIIAILMFFTILFGCNKKQQMEEYRYANSIEISPNDSDEVIITKAAHIIPTARQYEWQKLEFTAFLHFGINTFTSREWGTGKEDISIFTPKELDARQWVKIAKSGGMKMVMLTAKHHDGFCLWQTRTTEHSVKNTPWKEGKGDVLRELVNAAKEEGLKVGVYLSPADLYEIERDGGTYGNASETKLRKIPSDTYLQQKADTVFSYKLDDYNTLFMSQLYEVLTQYGEITEVWFDGANPKDGTSQKYNYVAWYDMIHKLQPNTVIAIKGPDVRWVGNEAGNSRENEWSVLPFSCKPSHCDWKDATETDLGSREKLYGAKYLYWYPAETDMPIRRGWFYRDDKQSVRSVDELLDVWYRSVGNNSVLLLNLSPNRHGLIPSKDARRITNLGNILKESFAENLLEKTNIEDVWKNILNEDLEKSIPLENTAPSLVFTFKEPQEFNRIVLQEDIKNFGQRIEEFIVSVWKNDAWQTIYESGTVGYKHIGCFAKQKSDKIKLQLKKSRLTPYLGFFGIYNAPERLSLPKIQRNEGGLVSIVCNTPDPIIYYTLDGSTPTLSSCRYTEPFNLLKGGLVKAIAVIDDGVKQSEVQEITLGIASEKWKIVEGAAFAKGFEVEKAIDGNSQTFWHTPWEGDIPKFPHTITINLGEIVAVSGITYLPRQDGNVGGVCTKYKIEGSLDGKNWQMLKEGQFANMKNNPVMQTVPFSTTKMEFIRFVALESVGKKPYFSMSELGVLAKLKR